MNEFVTAIIQDRQPLADVVMGLNLTVPVSCSSIGVKDGKFMKIAQYKL